MGNAKTREGCLQLLALIAVLATALVIRWLFFPPPEDGETHHSGHGGHADHGHDDALDGEVVHDRRPDFSPAVARSLEAQARPKAPR